MSDGRPPRQCSGAAFASGRCALDAHRAARANLEDAVGDDEVAGLEAVDHFHRAALARAERDFGLLDGRGLARAVDDIDEGLRAFGDDRDFRDGQRRARLGRSGVTAHRRAARAGRRRVFGSVARTFTASVVGSMALSIEVSLPVNVRPGMSLVVALISRPARRSVT